MRRYNSFSIRNRIELSATYPPAFAENARKLLSVSATGSNCLQHEYRHLRPTQILSFQYPQPDRIVCNS